MFSFLLENTEEESLLGHIGRRIFNFIKHSKIFFKVVKIKYYFAIIPVIYEGSIHILHYLVFRFSHYSWFISMFALFHMYSKCSSDSPLLFVSLFYARRIPHILEILGYQFIVKSEALRIYWKHCVCRKEDQIIDLTLGQSSGHLSSESGLLKSSFF